MSLAIPTELRAQVRALEQERCAYCQSPEELTVTPFEVDHVVPISAEGETVLDNLCLACPSCNRYKAARQSAPDPETGEAAMLYHPRRETWAKHFEWNAETLEVKGLTPTGRTTTVAPTSQPACPCPPTAAVDQDGSLPASIRDISANNASNSFRQPDYHSLTLPVYFAQQ